MTRSIAVRGSAGILARAIPFGIGAVVGGTGNHIVGRRVVQNARLAFGPPPVVIPEVLTPVEGPGAVRRLGSATGSQVARFGSATGNQVARIGSATGTRVIRAGKAVRGALPRRSGSGDTSDAGPSRELTAGTASTGPDMPHDPQP